MLTKEEFIEKARKIHGDKYDYSRVDEIVSYKKKIKIICHEKDENGVEHGEFEQIYYDHLNGHGCKKCMSKKIKLLKRSTTEEFIRKAIEIHCDKYDYSKVRYVNSKTKVCIICKQCGHEFWQTPNNHLRGYGCEYCIRKVTDLKSFIQVSNIVHNNKYDYSKSKYNDYDKPICIICHEKDENGVEHGEFWQTPHDHRNGRGCKKCGILKTKLKQMLTKEEFIEKARKIHGDKYDYSKIEYKGAYVPICIICHKKNRNGVEHGEFWQTPHAHLNGNGCPTCKESRCEKYIRVCLLEQNIKFIPQCNKQTFDWLGKQSLDFYLPDYNIAIECQGRQHFEPVNFFGGKNGFINNKENDIKKRKLCTEHNIKILYFAIDKRCENYLDKICYKLIFNKDELLKEIYERK